MTTAFQYLFNQNGSNKKDKNPSIVPADPSDVAILEELQSLVQQAAYEEDLACTSGTCKLPWVRGTNIHTRFANKVMALGVDYNTEISYLNGIVATRGADGSIRADAVYGDVHRPKFVVELKTGRIFNFMLRGEARKYLENLPEGTPVYPMRINY